MKIEKFSIVALGFTFVILATFFIDVIAGRQEISESEYSDVKSMMDKDPSLQKSINTAMQDGKIDRIEYSNLTDEYRLKDTNEIKSRLVKNP